MMNFLSPDPQRFWPPARSWRAFSLLLTLEMGIRGTFWTRSEYSPWIHEWLLRGKQKEAVCNSMRFRKLKNFRKFATCDQKTARSKGRLSKRYSFFGSWRKTLCSQSSPATSGRYSKQSLFWHPHLQPTQTLRRNEVSFIEWAIPALFCVQGGSPTTRNYMDYDDWISFNNDMNNLNDGKDRFILMGTLFIVLFLFLL